MKLLLESQKQVDVALEKILARMTESRTSDGPDGAHRVPPRLLDAMRYAVLSPGKRLRPALVFGGAFATGARMRDVVPAACAVEMIHAYSLVHDDLPALDDDDTRRGHPTVHRAFGEATAVLAGDALLTEAIVLLADAPLLGAKQRARPKDRIRAILELTRAAGAGGMVGGQQDDVEIEKSGGERDEREIRAIHLRKTGRLIQASSVLGALWSGAPDDVDILRQFGCDIGLAFQLIDDALDGDGMARIFGKDGVKREATRLTARAISHLQTFGKRSAALIELAEAMVDRAA